MTLVLGPLLIGVSSFPMVRPSALSSMSLASAGGALVLLECSMTLALGLLLDGEFSSPRARLSASLMAPSSEGDFHAAEASAGATVCFTSSALTALSLV